MLFQGRICLTLCLCAALLGCADLSRSRDRALTDASAAVESRAYDEPDRAAEHYLRKRLPLGASELPVERYFDALQHMRDMPQYSLSTGRAFPPRAQLEGSGLSYIADAAVLGTWEFLGPQNIGGRVRALVIHPTQPNTLWAAAVGGGVWKSTNGGTSWFPLSDLLPNIAVTSLALDPTNPNVLYAGTGEAYQLFPEGHQGKMIRGAGIFRSSNGGTTWARLKATVNSDFYYVNDIVVSKVNGLRIYAATKTGVWRSLNGGIAWTRVLNPNLLTGCGDLAIIANTAKPPDDLVFASCGLGYEQASIWRHAKAQGAGAWARVLAEPDMGRTTLAIAPSNPAVVYALASSSELNAEVFGAFHALFRSASSGAAGSWVAQARGTSSNPLTQLLLTNPQVALCRDPSFVIHQGWYDNAIAVDPKNPNRVWAGGIDLFRSDDGGKTWGIASAWWAKVAVPRVYAHADQHTIVFHPQYNGTTNKKLYVANDGGVFMTANATAAVGKTTAAVCDPDGIGVSWQKKNALGNTQFYHGAPWPDGSEFLGGTQDNGTNYGRAGFPAGWTEVLGGDGGYAAVGSSYLFAANAGLSLRRSTDGKDWQPISQDIQRVDSSLFIAPYALDPANGERLVVGGTRVWLTENSGTSWAPASNRLSPQGLSAITILDGAVMAGTPEGFLVTGAGSTQPRQGYVSSVAYDPNNAGVGYATYATFGGFHVWKTADNGMTWQPIDGSGTAKLPDVPVQSIVVDPIDPRRLYIGTDMGVFLTTDGGSTWAIENTGFPNVVVEWLAINEEAPRYLFAFTHGRSAWRVRLPPAQ